KFPSLIYVSRPGANIFKKSKYASEFRQKEKLTFLCVDRDLGQAPVPILPRGVGYVEQNEKLSCYQKINAYYAMASLARSRTAEETFAKQLAASQEMAFRPTLIESLFKWTFAAPEAHAPTLSAELTVYTVIKNDYVFLKRWYEHYKRIGVKRFI